MDVGTIEKKYWKEMPKNSKYAPILTKFVTNWIQFIFQPDFPTLQNERFEQSDL